MHPQNLRWGMTILPSPNTNGWLYFSVGIFYFSSVKYHYYIHFQSKYQLRGVRPLDPLFGLRPWTPLGDFCSSGYLPLCVNPSPNMNGWLYFSVWIFYFSSVKYHTYIHFQSKYQLGGVRPLDPLFGLRAWTQLGDFCFPGYLPLCVNQSPKVTEPLTPLNAW